MSCTCKQDRKAAAAWNCPWDGPCAFCRLKKRVADLEAEVTKLKRGDDCSECEGCGCSYCGYFGDRGSQLRLAGMA